MNDAELPSAPADDTGALRLGFTRGTAPSKWAKRWERAGGDPLELVPVETAFGRKAEAQGVDVMLERTRAGERPEGSSEPDRSRHAMLLYTEAVALVVPADHELAESSEISVGDLELVPLLDHPDHFPQWPAARSWEDPSWMPTGVKAALELVATGAGAILLPLPLARHLSDKRAHAVLPVTGEPELAGSGIWASWDVDRDAADVQQLVGIMRGRTARSSRPAAAAADGRTGADGRKPAKQARPKPAAKKAGPKPGSRGAQLAAAKEKAERAKALRRAEKKRKRR